MAIKDIFNNAREFLGFGDQKEEVPAQKFQIPDQLTASDMPEITFDIPGLEDVPTFSPFSQTDTEKAKGNKFLNTWYTAKDSTQDGSDFVAEVASEYENNPVYQSFYPKTSRFVRALFPLPISKDDPSANMIVSSHTDLIYKINDEGKGYEDYVKDVQSNRDTKVNEAGVQTLGFLNTKGVVNYGDKILTEEQFIDSSKKFREKQIAQEEEARQEQIQSTLDYQELGFSNKSERVNEIKNSYLQENDFESTTYIANIQDIFANEVGTEIGYQEDILNGAIDSRNRLIEAGASQESIDRVTGIVNDINNSIDQFIDKDTELMFIQSEKGVGAVREHMEEDLKSRGLRKGNGYGLLSTAGLRNEYLKSYTETERSQVINALSSPRDSLGRKRAQITEIESKEMLGGGTNYFQELSNLVGRTSNEFYSLGQGLENVGTAPLIGVARLIPGSKYEFALIGDGGYMTVSDDLLEESKAGERVGNTERFFGSMLKNGPEVGVIMAEMLIPLPKVSNARLLQKAPKLGAVSKKLIDSNKIVRKMGLSDESAKIIAKGYNRTRNTIGKFYNNVGQPVAKEFLIEGVFNSIDPDAGSTLSQNLMGIGFGLGVLTEIGPAIGKGLRSITGGSSDRRRRSMDSGASKGLDLINKVNDELILAGGKGISKVPMNLVNNVGEMYDSAIRGMNKFAKIEDAEGLVNNYLKEQLGNGVKNKAIIDDLFERGLVDAALIREADAGNEVAMRQLESRFNSDDTPANIIQYIKDIDSITSSDTSLFEMIERVTGVDYGVYKTTVQSLKRTPTYRISSRVMALFPEGKSVTTKTLFTEAEVNSIVSKSKNNYGFDKSKHFIKDGDKYRLNVENLGPDVGIEKTSFSDGDIKTISESEGDFIDTLDKINKVSGSSVYDLQKIQQSGVYDNITGFLSRIIC